MSVTRRCGGGRRPERAARVGDNGYVETDPTGRYGRFDELLGKGAMKSVYRGFDEERGVEVAWNQASLADVLRSPDAVQRMYSEVQLLSSLRHDGIIGFHASWVDVPGRSFNFITELFSSGTLRSYRLRYPRVSLRAVRSWARQLLGGLAYLHARDPPVIHRDLKCDNIFVNGHQGQVKIGDLGLAAVLGRRGGAAHSVIGTPEFMAPEMYDEEYDERVDVYAFGMCMLEMLTVEYPYSECSNPAQIYKKVTAGRLPDAFHRVDDDDARRFIGRCLVPAANRPSAAELLLDPFLIDDHGHRHHHVAAAGTVPVTVPAPLPAAVAAAGVPPPSTCSSSADDVVSASSSLDDDEGEHHQDPQHPPPRNDMTITGKLNAEEDTIFLKVQIADEATGHARNIYFPFDMASDTAAEVAQEMVKELDITDRDAPEIAAMIQQEIGRLLPGRAQQQHEYTYAERDADDDDDENDEERPPPFCCYLSSSPASSHGSHCGMGPYASGGFPGPRGGGWSKGADEAEPMPSCCTGSGSSKTRFGGGGSSASMLARQLQRQCSMSPQHQHAGRPRRREDNDGTSRRRRMTRNRSMVDMRSQLLHRTLVEELNRRLFFNTVGAVENIGFRAPTTTSPSASSSSASAAARGGLERGIRRPGGGKQPLDDKQQYFMQSCFSPG
ncbi:probable serine/threonine-protein kinase WNK7 isoform X2 [Miscanthus floridulus]|uniref:probable serine/threonine-protein kinase WNK7 isoform X2 n=1 Tax=Miscanthus floridulus TaxID=154761 RepID=UPI00345AD363